MRDPYTVLGIARKASPEIVKQAYRALAKQHHPDLAGSGKVTANRFQEINAAYALLKDKTTKSRYDRGEIHPNGSPIVAPQRSANGFKAKGSPAPRRAAPVRSRNGKAAGLGTCHPDRSSTTFTTRQKTKIAAMGREAMEKMAAARSASRTSPVAKKDKSKPCAQSKKPTSTTRSAQPARPPRDLRADEILANIFTTVMPNTAEEQPRNGADALYSLSLPFEEAARGTTRRVKLPSGRLLDVEIPFGVQNGQQIRLRGQGDLGLGDGQSGDALIEIEIKPHDYFSRKGDDIYLTLPVTVDEAIFGANVMVPTLDGPMAITIPAGSNADTTLPLPGKGFARPSKQVIPDFGDQYVILKIVLPTAKGDEFAKLVRNWAAVSPYHVRSEFDISARHR